MKIKIDLIKPNPQQPRTEFDPEELQSLADSIAQVGLVNAIAVEENGDGSYTLIDGERRVRAAKLAGLLWIEATVSSRRNGNSDHLRLAEATAANMQRSGMNVVEQAKAIRNLFDAGYSMGDIQSITGLSQSPINVRLDILSFSQTIQDLFSAGRLPIDTRLVSAIKNHPEHLRDSFLTRCAARKMGASRIVSIISFQKKLGEAGKRSSLGRKSRSDTECAGALDETKNKNIPEQLSINVSATCKRCDMADRLICRSCPVTDLLDNWKS